MYEVVITRSLPPRCVNSERSSMMSRRPLHFTNETSISTRSADCISFLSSLIMLGSWIEPVNRELAAREVSGRTGENSPVTAVSVFFFSATARSCSARSATDIPSKSLSPVTSAMAETILFASESCPEISSELTCRSPFSTSSLM